MINEYYFEFSKIYRRLMRLEAQLKKMLISSLLAYYKEDVINIFQNFFSNRERLARYNNKSGNSMLAILKNPQITLQSKKFIRLVNIMYLSDILFLVLCCEEFRKDEIINNFYFKKPEKFGLLNNNRENLINLRNAIAHYKFKDYRKNKHAYLDALLLFEVHIGCNIKGIAEIPRFKSKPSVRNILQAIKNLRPDLLDLDPNKDDEMEYFYNKHRILMDLCDDIALYNGFEVKDLPSPWTILREMYSIKSQSKIKPQKQIKIEDTPLFQALKPIQE